MVALFLGFSLSQRREQAAAKLNERFVCPMHPQIIARTPGACPICGMKLEPMPDPSSSPTSVFATPGSIEAVRSRVLSGPVRAPAWVGADGSITAVFYKEDFLRVAPAQAALFFLSDAPAAGLDARLLDEPPQPWDGSTLRVRFRLGSIRGWRTTPARITQAKRSATDVGWIEITPKPRAFPVVPWSAVLYSAGGPYVPVASKKGGHAFTQQAVEIGKTIDERAEHGRVHPDEIVVLSGVTEGERILAGKAFFSDVERRRSAAEEREATQ